MLGSLRLWNAGEIPEAIGKHGALAVRFSERFQSSDLSGGSKHASHSMGNKKKLLTGKAGILLFSFPTKTLQSFIKE